MAPPEKRCPRCGELKAASDFYLINNRNKGVPYPRLSPYCRPCTSARAREWQRANPETFKASRRKYQAANRDKVKESTLATNRKRLYGITREQYAEMLAAQDGVCAICRQRSTKPLGVDHDHATGAVRGLLCGPCNSGIGFFRDQPDLLDAAITYLHFGPT